VAIAVPEKEASALDQVGLYCVQSVYSLPNHGTADPLVTLIHLIEWNQLKVKIATPHRSGKTSTVDNKTHTPAQP
jgi:hypothetical protein